VLRSRSNAVQTRALQQVWSERGITGVPSMVFDGKYLLTGAQGMQTYMQMLQKTLSERSYHTTD
jgi:predicted DsbA family dithiol-disulfide isomerase